MAQAKIVVVGSTNVDMVVKSTQIPRPGETVLGGAFTMVPGGKGANQAVAAARMGADVTFVARIGSDAFGNQALEGFAAEGIRTDYVVRDSEAAHGVALILIDQTGENAIAVAPGANARLTAEDVKRAEAAFAECDVVLLQLEVPLPAVQAAAALAKRHGKKLILNPAPYLAVPNSLLAAVDILTPNETEAEMLLGGGEAGLSGVAGTAEELLRRGVGCVIVTLGREGVFVVRPEGQYHLAGRRVKTIDTTAAGDAFSGALAVAIAEGIEFRTAVKYAVAASALTVTRLGAQSSLPARAEVEALVAS
ncbi:MAG: ribokinase [Armatimonadetes bacterium]|jgi:ribokinase|nr:ribokinase [Armatimonadota bacterium]